jgi:hypothetical protein
MPQLVDTVGSCRAASKIAKVKHVVSNLCARASGKKRAWRKQSENHRPRRHTISITAFRGQNVKLKGGFEDQNLKSPKRAFGAFLFVSLGFSL